MVEIAIATIQKAASGDMEAFEEIYKTFSSSVYAITLNITRNRQDAQDATQEVFVRVFRSLKGFRFGSSFGTWLYRIATNTAINTYHNRSRHRKNMVNIDEVGELALQKTDMPEAPAKEQIKESKISGMLDHLTPEHRACIILREVEGFDYRQMSEALGIPLNTVRSRLKRAREALVAYCRKEGFRYGL